MKLSATHLDAINDAKPGYLHLAMHPTRREVLIAMEGTTVVLGLTEEQVGDVIDQLTILRDRLVCRPAVSLPYRPTPHTIAQ